MTTEPTKPKPRRRFRQYSLRTLFVLLTVFGVWLGWTVHRANEQRKAVEWVRKIGGGVAYDYQIDADGRFIADAEPPGPKWLAQLIGADYFQEVSFVELHEKQISDMTLLANLASLETLHIDDTQVSDLTPLAGLKNLEGLLLNNTPVSDLTPLAKLTSLELLSFKGTQVSDLTPLTKLTSLPTLCLTTRRSAT